MDRCTKKIDQSYIIIFANNIINQSNHLVSLGLSLVFFFLFFAFKSLFQAMKFLTRNVAGLNQYHRLHQTLRQARNHDIIFLQETKLKMSQASFIRAKWGSNNIFMACMGTARRGVLTLLHPRLNPTYFTCWLHYCREKHTCWSMFMGILTLTGNLRIQW